MLLVSIVALMALASTSMAVPNLQIYIPGGEYNAATETWTTSSGNHEVWVIAANLDKGELYDIQLVASLLNGDQPGDGTLSITDEGGATTNFSATDFSYGTPPVSDPLPGHGVFPTNYAQLLVTSVTSGPYQLVNDYVPGDDGGTSLYGMIFKYTVSTTYDVVHYDAYGFYNDADGRRVSAPFSHDGQYGVPEPTTALLFGLGMLGAGIVRKYRR
ncbi:MAG: choice-of-anchor N protein [bacterium]|nr:choice-of-anchor N protein [bacterium]